MSFCDITSPDSKLHDEYILYETSDIWINKNYLNNVQILLHCLLYTRSFIGHICIWSWISVHVKNTNYTFYIIPNCCTSFCRGKVVSSDNIFRNRGIPSCPGTAWSFLANKVTMMALSNGNISCVTGPMCGEFAGEFPSQRPVTRYFDVFFDLRLNKCLSEQ